MDCRLQGKQAHAGAGDAHVVAADDVEAQGHLLHARRGGEDALVAVLQDDVGRLVEALEQALWSCRHDGRVCGGEVVGARGGSASLFGLRGRCGRDGRTTMLRPSLVMTLITPARMKNGSIEWWCVVWIRPRRQQQPMHNPHIPLTFPQRLQRGRHGCSSLVLLLLVSAARTHRTGSSLAKRCGSERAAGSLLLSPDQQQPKDRLCVVVEGCG